MGSAAQLGREASQNVELPFRRAASHERDVDHVAEGEELLRRGSVPKRWVTIASADDDMVSGEMLKWCGVGDAWSKIEYDPDVLYDFLVDVVEHCSHAEVEREDWDADMPGRSGVWHVVKTDAPEQLKREIRARLAKILWKGRARIREEP